MLARVARSASVSPARPRPKYSTNLPTTPVFRSSSVTVSTRSVAVAPSRNRPYSRKPTTCGTSIESGSPRIRASAALAPPPATAPASVAHGRVRVGADGGVRERDAVAVLDHAREVLEVDLMADP